eukprot:202526-Alexandrium_andersonii.AAC.1
MPSAGSAPVVQPAGSPSTSGAAGHTRDGRLEEADEDPGAPAGSTNVDASPIAEGMSIAGE